MTGSIRIIVAIFVALFLVVAGFFAWWFINRDDRKQPVEMAVEAPPMPDPTPTPGLEERLSARLSGTTLSTSDAVVQELVAALSSNPSLVAWLANDDLIRRFTASVDNVAAGRSPRSHLDFLRPKEGFEVDENPDGTLVIEPSSYKRFDRVAHVISSLDTEGSVALYRELKPLIDEAYAEIGPPNRTFDERLAAAFDQLLAVPVLDEPAQVNQLILTYAWADEELESMSDVQRHFLRMGPENVSLIQSKLGEIRAALATSD